MAKPATRARTERRRPLSAREAPREPKWLRQLRSLEVPAVAEPIDLRRAWPHVLGVFAVVLALYAATAARSVCFEDDGLFILSARSLGLPQPPGYPLDVLVGNLFTHLPFGSLAYRVHLMSAACGAATCAVVWLVLQLLFKDRLASWAGALLLAVSGELWSQAIVAKTYTLNTFLFFLVVYLILDYGTSGRPRTLYALSATYGLSLANHWPLMGLSTACLVLLLLPRWRDVLRRLPSAAGLALLCAVVPYIWMVWRSHQDPEINFYGPIRSVKELWFFLTRKGFGKVDVSETSRAADRLQYLGFMLRECGRQFTVVGGALAALGLVLSWRRLPRALALALLAGFLGSSFVLLFLLSFDYGALYRSVFRTYPLIPYGLMVIWLVLGGSVLLQRVRPVGVRAALWGALVAATLATHLPENQRSSYGFARDYSRAVLESLDKDAILFVHGDMDAFPIAYEHLGEGVRPDVTLYNDQGLMFDNRLYRFDASSDEIQRALGAFIRSTSRPVYFVDSQPIGFTLQDGGLHVRVRPELQPGQIQFELTPQARAFIERMEAEPSHDQWTLIRRDQLRRRLAKVLAFFQKYEPGRYDAGMAALEARLAATSQGKLGKLDLLTIDENGMDAPAVLAQAELAEAALGDGDSMEDRASPAHARAKALLHAGRPDEAEAALRDSIRIYPSHKNPAAMDLVRLYARTGRKAEFADVVNRYFIYRALGPGLEAELYALKAKLDRL
jgi:hypothetical protein